MEKIKMLGTGAAMVTKCYNTCFALSKDNNEHFLVDTGGGNTILSNLEKLDISVDKIHHVFISHSHNDHITGIFWIIRAVSQSILDGNYQGDLHIYCSEDVESVIRTVSGLLLQKKFVKFIDDRIIFVPVTDCCRHVILGYDLAFFNIKSDKQIQYGFTMILECGKKLAFLGDEPYRDAIHDPVVDSDYLLHEAFCLHSDRDVFKPYEKFHATVKDACINASSLNVKNLILYHTVDNNLEDRRSSYLQEGRKYFSGNIIVPDDLDIIELV